MQINRLLAQFGIALVLFGAGLMFYVQDSQPVINKNFNTNTYHSPQPSTKISGMPSELLIPSLNMDLTVIPGYYNPSSQTWNLTLSEVQYAVSTPQPNNLSGATFIYGHYRREVFAYLHTIQPGAQAMVKTTNGHTFYYQLASIRTTSPTDDSVFSYSGPPELMIQTCSGAFFQYRQFYTFNLVKVV